MTPMLQSQPRACRCSLCWLAASPEWVRDDGFRWSLPQGAYEPRQLSHICNKMFDIVSRFILMPHGGGDPGYGLCEGNELVGLPLVTSVRCASGVLLWYFGHMFLCRYNARSANAGARREPLCVLSG
jgi:hypothetical protein